MEAAKLRRPVDVGPRAAVVVQEAADANTARPSLLIQAFECVGGELWRKFFTRSCRVVVARACLAQRLRAHVVNRLNAERGVRLDPNAREAGAHDGLD